MEILIGVAAGLLALWLALLVALAAAQPRSLDVRDALRLVPDVLRLLRALARDRALSRATRWRLGLLLGYLLMPIDLVPDFIPVLGYADDVVVLALALRSVVRRAGPEALDRHWAGTAEGLVAVRRLASLVEGNPGRAGRVPPA